MNLHWNDLLYVSGHLTVQHSPLNVAENGTLSICCSVKFASFISHDHHLLLPQLVLNLPRDDAVQPNITTVIVDGNVISTATLRIPAGVSKMSPIACDINFPEPAIYFKHHVQSDYINVSSRPGALSCCRPAVLLLGSSQCDNIRLPSAIHVRGFDKSIAYMDEKSWSQPNVYSRKPQRKYPWHHYFEGKTSSIKIRFYRLYFFF